MKVIQVNSVYRTGSTGKIVYDIHTELQKHGIESIVCYGRGKKTNEPNVYKTCSEVYSKFNNLLTRFAGLMYGGCIFSTYQLIRIIKKEKPDVVHLHCINGYFVNIYRLITWLKMNQIKTVLTLHAEFMYTGNCGYALDCEKWKTGCGNCSRLKKETKSLFFDRTHTSWQKMKDAFECFNDNLIVASVSPWLMERAEQSPILANKGHVVVLNGIDTNNFHPYDTSELKKKHGITKEKVILHVTANFNPDPNHNKGGYYVLEMAKRMKDQPVRFLVAGYYDSKIIPPKNLEFLGRIEDQTLLAHYYSMADVTLLTSKKETFSMVCAESLCCGTPVVGFKAGGPELISLPQYSEFVEYGNLELLQETMILILTNKNDEHEISNYSSIKYSKYSMMCMYCANYTDYYKK